MLDWLKSLLPQFPPGGGIFEKGGSIGGTGTGQQGQQAPVASFPGPYGLTACPGSSWVTKLEINAFFAVLLLLGITAIIFSNKTVQQTVIEGAV